MTSNKISAAMAALLATVVVAVAYATEEPNFYPEYVAAAKTAAEDQRIAEIKPMLATIHIYDCDEGDESEESAK